MALLLVAHGYASDWIPSNVRPLPTRRSKSMISKSVRRSRQIVSTRQARIACS